MKINRIFLLITMLFLSSCIFTRKSNWEPIVLKIGESSKQKDFQLIRIIDDNSVLIKYHTKTITLKKHEKMTIKWGRFWVNNINSKNGTIVIKGYTVSDY